MKKYIPVKNIREQSMSPWFNADLKELMNKKKGQFTSTKSANTPCVWDKYRATAKLFDSLLARSRRTFFGFTLPSLIRSSPQQFCRTINPRDSSTSSFLLGQAGIAIAKHQAAETLNTTFPSVFTNELPIAFQHTHSDYPCMPNINFDPCDSSKIIDSLKLTSSVGTDGINSKVLKNTKHIISIILAQIFQQSLESGSVPLDWKIGKVIPIPTNGSTNTYRPITLTSVC